MMTKEPERKRMKVDSPVSGNAPAAGDLSTAAGMFTGGNSSHLTAANDALSGNCPRLAFNKSVNPPTVVQHNTSGPNYKTNSAPQAAYNLPSAQTSNSETRLSSEGLQNRISSRVSSSSVAVNGRTASPNVNGFGHLTSNSNGFTSANGSNAVEQNGVTNGDATPAVNGTQCTSRSTKTNGLKSPSGDSKEMPDLLAKKKNMNLSSQQFQDGVERFISDIGQQNGRALPKVMLCTFQLCILMHASQCKRPISCQVQQCKIIKSVINHMSMCTNSKCEVAHCLPSKRLIHHWNTCASQNCDLCKLILGLVNVSSPERGETPDVGRKCPASAFPSSASHQQPAIRDVPDDVAMETENQSVDRTMVARSDASDAIDVVDVSSHSPAVQSPASDGDADQLASDAVWNPSEFVNCLKPILERLANMGVASSPFLRPVNPSLDLCPDYFSVISKPMDLSTIRSNLNRGVYKNPWGFINDVYLMLRNAWTYNHHTSKYYKYATKLALSFEEQIDSIMQSLGYCCGRQYRYNPPIIDCNTTNACAIKPYAFYYMTSSGHVVCEACYCESNAYVSVYHEATQKTFFVAKTTFMRKRNCELPPEEIVSCTRCGRAFHSVCVLYTAELWPFGYVCKVCVLFYGIKHVRNHVSSQTIPETALGRQLEDRINRFFAKRNMPNPGVRIRIVASYADEFSVLPEFKQHFPGGNQAFSYVSKAIYAFQEQNGEDVCFFGMYVQEYGSDVPHPNTRSVYLAYLDSVNLFTPSSCRTGLYNELILGYMEYVKRRGFMKLFIWSCPPSPGDDYIFYCHPDSQKTPKARRLHEWYRTMLDRGVSDGIVKSYKDIFIYALEQNIQSASDIPYFSGDYWPTAMEEMLGDVDREAANAVKQTADTNGFSQQSEKPQKKRGYKAKGTKSRRTPVVARSSHDALLEKLYDSLKKNKEMFFVVEFFLPQDAARLPPIMDEDEHSPNELMNNRTSFLIYARSNRLEFSSLRRAKFSTQATLIEYLRYSSYGFVCGQCGVGISNVNGLFVCRTCRNFRLCVVCYSELGHVHKLHQDFYGKELLERNAKLKCIIEGLKHAAVCQQPMCSTDNCETLKGELRHLHNCTVKLKCLRCRDMKDLVLYHSHSCSEQNCCIFLCKELRKKQSEKRRAQKINEARMMRRRLHMMALEGSSDTDAPSTTSSAPNSTTNCSLTDVPNSSISSSHSKVNLKVRQF